jgi:hypothetical protein
MNALERSERENLPRPYDADNRGGIARTRSQRILNPGSRHIGFDILYIIYKFYHVLFSLLYISTPLFSLPFNYFRVHTRSSFSLSFFFYLLILIISFIGIN